MNEMRKDRRGHIKNVDYEALKEAARKSPYKGEEISDLMGRHANWFNAMCYKQSAVKEEDLKKLCLLLQVPFEELITAISEEENNESPKAPETTPKQNLDLAEIGQTLSAINQTLSELFAFLKELREEDRPIPVSKSERATALLRKELMAKNGGGVKIEEYKRLLVQAGIGSSYVENAMAELRCKKLVGNNGITYIVKEERA